MDQEAAVADAGFDAARCPASYDVVALPGPSRYRLIADGHPAWTQSDACAADLPGATHLAVLTSDEIARVGALVTTPPQPIAGNAVWVGAVQQRTAIQPGDDWLWVDGEPLINGWGGIEPNDRGDGEADHDEQFAKIEKAKPYLTDTAGGDNNGALCQCDGKPIAASAAAAITANRPAG